MFGPACGDVGVVDGDGVLAGGGFAAVMDGVGFDKPWLEFIPLVCFDGDLVFQQGTWFGGGAALDFEFGAYGFKEPVYGGGGYA